MSLQILTLDDLNQFKSELFKEIKEILKTEEKTSKKWLRTKEVLELLKVSPGTLQTYRINGLLKYSKIGKTIYYSLTDIEEILKNKSN